MSTINEPEIYGRYSVVIEWSDEDGVYVVTLPEFPGCHTHGATREEALKNAQEVIELVVDTDRELGRPLPPPNLFSMDEPDTNKERQVSEYETQRIS